MERASGVYKKETTTAGLTTVGDREEESAEACSIEEARGSLVPRNDTPSSASLPVGGVAASSSSRSGPRNNATRNGGGGAWNPTMDRRAKAHKKMSATRTEPKKTNTSCIIGASSNNLLQL